MREMFRATQLLRGLDYSLKSSLDLLPDKQIH